MPKSDNHLARKDGLKWFMVSDKKNGTTFYPKTISQIRKNTSTWITALVGLVIFIGAIVICEIDLPFQLEVFSYGGVLFFLVELIYRMILLHVEYKYHFTSRYENDHKKLLNHIFQFSTQSILLLLAFIIILFVSYSVHGCIDLTSLIDKPLGLGLNLCSLLFLQKLSHIDRAPIYDSLKIEENNGLNYGSGMAYSFFYGYLKLILPKSGKEDKNLIEEMEIYEDSQGVSFPVAKLFILLPKSCVCHVSLKDDKFPNIEESSSLGEKIQTVAAVQNRVYKNSVYKIYDERKKERLYVCVEFATPLRTFREGLKHSGPHTEYYKRHSQDIVLQFYMTLKKLLADDHEITDFCDLIYYDDMDESGKFRDVAQIIVTRIRKLQKQFKKND